VGSSSVVGGECSWWAPEEVVDEHREREREESLDDALREAGEGLGEVVSHAHLLFERREHRLDHEPGACFGDLGGRTLTELVFVGNDQRDTDEAEAFMMHAAAVPGVGEQHTFGVCAGKLKDALALVLVGGLEVIAVGVPARSVISSSRIPQYHWLFAAQ